MPPTPARPGDAAWSYDARASADLETLDVDARFAAGAGDALRGDDDGTARFVRDLELATTSGWRAIPATGAAWSVACAAGCRVRYRFRLRDAARVMNDADTAIAAGESILAPPSTWLLRPAGAPPAGILRLRVMTAPGARFVAGFRSAGDTFTARARDLDESSYAAFGPLHAHAIEAGGARFDLALAADGVAPARLTNDDAAIVDWIATDARAIAAYYAPVRLPIARVLVLVAAGRGGPTRGKTLGDGGPAVLLRPGDDLHDSPTPLAKEDWVATHELLHVVFPHLDVDHAWLNEGLASYVEPIVRARAGLIDDAKFWGDLVEGLPQGLPARGDQGLVRTHTWERTYWGGALFCLVADVRIREATGGARSLDDVLRAIAAAGGNVETGAPGWDAARVVAEGDRATGVSVLSDLYRSMALAPVGVDLAELWRRLGVIAPGAGKKGVSFDDAAPLATLRRAITRENAARR